MIGFFVGILLNAVPPEGATIAVLPMNATEISDAAATLLDEILLTEVDRFRRYEVIGASDVGAMLGMERLKDALGCDDTTCASELGGALGASVVLSSRLGVLGENLVVSSKLVDTRGATVLARATVTVVNDPSAYPEGVRRVVRELFADGTAAEQLSTADPGLEAFLHAGLTRQDYLDYANGGMAYWRWAEERNRESVLLEVTKWGLTGASVFFVGMGFLLGSMSDSSFARNFMLGYGTFVGVGAGAVWGVDLMNFGTVPSSIEGVPSGLGHKR